jgi:putative CocE/NonD family hydrolase
MSVKKMRVATKRTFIAAAVTAGLLYGATPLRAQSYAVTIQQNVPMKTRDGVTLHADIYRPQAEGKFPVLLTRTPYNKTGNLNFGMRAAARGYVVIVQDVRGRYESGGEWTPFVHEEQDGYDTVEWAATLPYSNGKVGMFGGSYVGATQMLAAIAHPPHLAGISPDVTASNYHDGWTYQGGAFEQWFNESWASGLAENTLSRRVSADTNAMNWKNVLPLESYPLLALPQAAALGPYFRDWLAHPSYDDYWKKISIEEQYAQIQVPVFTMAAWYDIFLGGSLRNYIGLREHAGTEAARNGQRLLIYIGGHAGGPNLSKVGEVHFGAQAPFDADEVRLSWYDTLLKGAPAKWSKPVRIFVMGRNEWRDEDAWPLERAKSTRYYLHSNGSAASVTAGGTLSTDAPQAERGDSYVYDPANPVPTIGGPLCCDADHLAPGPWDQRSNEDRSDVLVYTTTPFQHNTEVTGPVLLDLYASTSAKDTDFTGKLVDVWPNGFPQNLTEGILRLRYRDSPEAPELAKPGKIYRVTVDLWATSSVFLAGHRLRLEVSSSNFPRFDRNLNTGETQATATRLEKARNIIYHDTEHPSALILPVIPE